MKKTKAIAIILIINLLCTLIFSLNPGKVFAASQKIDNQISKIDDKHVIQTKGDANNTPDAWEVTDDEILGVVNYSIKYIGYPTLWFNEIYEGKETE